MLFIASATGGAATAASDSATQDQINSVLSACQSLFTESACGVPVNVSSGNAKAWYNAAGCIVDHRSHFTPACIAAFNSVCGRNGDGCISANQGGGSVCGDAKTGCASELIVARQKIFGIENVDAKTGAVSPDKVIFSWITNASFAASVMGRIVLLDTFVTRLEEKPGRTPFVIQDLVDLRPEALFIGHGHFDHADNAAYLSGKTGAVIYASPETCDNMQLDAVKIFGAGSTVPCVGVTSRGSLPGSEVVTLDALDGVASVTAFKHLHSTNTAPQDKSFPPVVITTPDATHPCPAPAKAGDPAPPCNIANPRDAALFPPGKPIAQVMDIAASRAGNGGAISIFYHFVVRGGNQFTFNWHNTTGAIREGCALPNNIANSNPPVASQPGQDVRGCFGPAVGQRVASVMESLRPTDVELGSVVSLGFNINGERDIVDYNTHIAPKIFIPNHVTAVAVEGSSLEWRQGYLAQQNAMGIPQSQRPELIWLVDPTDYLRPIVFDPKDKQWQKNNGNGQ